MLKIVINDVQRFVALSKIPIIGRLFVFNVACMKTVSDKDLYNDLICSLRYGDVTGKETYPNRLAEIDVDIVKLLRAGDTFHDVGCSSGITTLDLYNRMKAAKLAANITISDRFTSFQIAGKYITQVTCRQDGLRQVYLGKVLFDPNLSSLFFVSKLLFPVFKMVGAPSKQSVSDLEEIRLLDPEVEQLVQGGKMNLLDFNVFEGDERQYRFVRCMNLLNKSYFESDDIAKGLRVLASSVSDGGFLCIGRTNDKRTNNATLFKRSGEHFLIEKQYGNGSEILDIVHSTLPVTEGS